MMTNEQQIEEIMDWFDFRRVHTAMVALGWEWSSSDGVPSEAELRSHARAYLREVAVKGEASKTGFYKTGSGGFMATRYESGELGLEFILEEWVVEFVEDEEVPF